jgi:hypothetical protein
MIIDNSITNAKMADNSVNTAELVDDAVTNAKMANNSVNTNELVNGAVSSAKILDGDIATADLADNVITPAKVNSTGAATGQALYYNGTTVAWGSPVASGFTGSLSGDVTGTQSATVIAPNAVNSAKIADGSIVDADISGTAAIAYSKLNLAGSIVTGDIVDGTITDADISGTAAIAYSKLDLASSIVTGDIVDGTIATADLANNAVTAAQMSTTGATTSGDVLTYTGTGTPVWQAPSASSLSGTVAITNGGTGATTAAAALNNLGVYSGSVPLNVGDLSATINVTGISATSTIIVTYSDVNGAGLVMGYVTAQGSNSATVTLSGAVPVGASASLHYIVIP